MINIHEVFEQNRFVHENNLFFNNKKTTFIYTI